MVSDAHPLQEERTIVQLVMIDETGDSYYRMRWPGRELSLMAPEWRVISLDASAKERFELGEKADLLILFQSHDQDLLPLISRRRAAGKKTLVEYNDHFYDSPVTSPAHEFWSSPLNWDIYERIMNDSDGVIVTGPGLKQLFSEKTKKPIFEIKNQLPDPSLIPFEELWTDPAKELRLGWGGSMGHLPDLFSFLPVIRELISEIPHLKLYLMGNDAIPNYLDISPDRFHFVPWGSMESYFQFLESLHIGFAPLLDTPYNRCRSDIKAVEMSSRGVLPILPTALPYEEFLRETNLEGYASPADFKMKVLAYAKNAEKIKDDAKRCYSYVGQKRLGSQHRERLELCAKMMTTKPSISPIALAKGYHEIQGTPEMHPPFRDSLIKIQNLFNQRQRGEALKILEEEIAKNPKNPELALAHLKSLKIIQSQGILEKCIHYAQLFQTDLRFLLFRIEVTASTSDRMNLWEGLLSTLSTQPKNARQFYRNLTIPLLVKDLSENKELLNIAKKFLDLFESSASLRYEIAKAYEFQGKTKEALKEFEWILKKANEFSQNRDFISSLNLMEIQTYISSLS